MKTILSIPLIIVLLFSGININFASHYCSGYLAGSRVSFNGELATCGMETTSDVKPDHNIITNHCCDDIVSIYSISNNYFPSSFNIGEPSQQIISIFFNSPDYLENQVLMNIISNREIRPPGSNYPNSVLLSSICIFRI
jgi:hypothetical protein